MTVTLYYKNGCTEHYPHVLAFGYGEENGAKHYRLTERNVLTTETGREAMHKIRADIVADYEIGED